MCGIVGILAPADESVDVAMLSGMADCVAHRGPDGEGFLLVSGPWTAPDYTLLHHVDRDVSRPAVRLGLGHRRLAILDLSERGLQPMCSENRQAWTVFNGEIYNHREIRQVLQSKGYRFTTRTDTEVLVNAYLEWGSDFVNRLEGMFAFAIWDTVNKRLFCARDRLGIKPFYFRELPSGAFAFASEIKALLRSIACPPEAEDEAVVGFLAHGNCDYGERTLFRGVYALPAGHTLTVENTGDRSIRRYWSLAAAGEQRTQSDTEYLDAVRTLLVETVRKHLISDVRIGSCLSGGLDSSAIVGFMGKISRDDPASAVAIRDRLFTFTSCYEQNEFDEREYALAVAHSVAAQPHLVFPTPEDFWTNFERMAWHQDMPFGALSFYAQWRVMRAASEAGVKVLLDGQGGDEVFGGYAKFRYAYLASLMRSGRVKTFSNELLATFQHGDRYVLDIRKGFRYLPGSVRRALNVDTLLQQVVWDWPRIVADESTPATRWWRYATNGHGSENGLTFVQRMQVDDIVTDTLPQLLRMEDRSSMAFSLEARVPMLDHKVVEMGVSLPDHLKFNNGWSKFAVRQAVDGVIPDKVRLRKTKLGFAAPDRSWLTGELRASIGELLSGDLRCTRYIDVPALRRWYRASDTKRVNTESFLGLFRILSLEMWMRAFAV